MLNGRIKTTALVLTYNQEDCIEEAIRSVVGQTIQPDEILVSDDCSADATYERVQNIVHELVRAGTFKGSFRLNKNKENLGFIPHFNWAVQECSGEFILYNAGDDTSMPDRLETFLKAYEQQGSPEYFLGHSSVQIKGGPQDGGIWVPPVEQAKFPIERLANSSALHIGAAQCFTKSLFNDFGPIRFNDAYEDLILGFRALLTNAYWYSPRPLLTYRVGGLTFWQKNTWEKKRKRYKAVLSQRNLDALKHGRPDLVKEIALAYRDYGFSLSPHPDCIDVYSRQDTEESLFDYSVEEHFHRLPHLIKRRPLEEFFQKYVRSAKAFNKERTLVFLRLSLLGWEQVISYLEQLNGLGVCAAVDCGISSDSLQTLDNSSDLRSRFQKLFLTNRTFKITCACPVMGKKLTHLFNGAFVPSPLLMDVDGPSIQREPDKKEEPLKLLLACEPSQDLVVDPKLLQHELRWLQKALGIRSLQFFVPSFMLKPLQECIVSLTSCMHQIFELKNCHKKQINGFDHLILFADEKSGRYSLLFNLKLQAINESKSMSLVTGGKEERSFSRDCLDSLRANLYFEKSIQKRVDNVLAYLGVLLGNEMFAIRFKPL